MYLAAKVFRDQLPEHINTMEKFENLLVVVGPIPRILFHPRYTSIERYLDQRELLASTTSFPDI